MTVVSRSANPVPTQIWRSGRTPRRWFNSAYLFLAPACLVLAIFVVYPLLATAWISFFDWRVGGRRTWVGFSNYIALVSDERFWNSLRVTLSYTVFVVVGQVVIALLLAQLLRRTNWFNSLMRSAFYFPSIASLAVVGVIWQFLLDPQIGMVQIWLRQVGLGATDPLRDTAAALPAVIVVGVWRGMGFVLIILLAGLQGVPQDLHEAALLDGANAWQEFIRVTMPIIRPALTYAAVISTIQALQLFELSYVMTKGGPLFQTESVVMYLYQRGFVQFRMGYASAIAWVLFLIIMAVSMLQLRMMRVNDAD